MSSSRAGCITAGLEDALALAPALEEQKNALEAVATYAERHLPVVHRYQASSREVSNRIGPARRPQTMVL